MGPFHIGEKLRLDDLEATIIGCIRYRNPSDQNHKWIEYRLQSDRGPCRLSWDDRYKKYWLSWPVDLPEEKGFSPAWEMSKEGEVFVLEAFGEVDVHPGEKSLVSYYQDESEEKILTLERRDKELSVFEGQFLKKRTIVSLTPVLSRVAEFIKASPLNKISILYLLLFILPVVYTFFCGIIYIIGRTDIEEDLKNDSNFVFVGKMLIDEDEFAVEYQYLEARRPEISDGDSQEVELDEPDWTRVDDAGTLEALAKSIFTRNFGRISQISETVDDDGRGATLILTINERCLIYRPMNRNKIYIRIEER